MSEPESKKLEALWDFVRALAMERAGWSHIDSGSLKAARALLSVLAEEAPPRVHDVRCQVRRSFGHPCCCEEIRGAAPAPKQEVRDSLGIIEDVIFLPGVGQHACDKLGYAIRLLREERAASERALATIRETLSMQCRITMEEGRKVASLRERVEKAKEVLENTRPSVAEAHRTLCGEGRGEGTEATK